MCPDNARNALEFANGALFADRFDIRQKIGECVIGRLHQKENEVVSWDLVLRSLPKLSGTAADRVPHDLLVFKCIANILRRATQNGRHFFCGKPNFVVWNPLFEVLPFD